MLTHRQRVAVDLAHLSTSYLQNVGIWRKEMQVDLISSLSLPVQTRAFSRRTKRCIPYGLVEFLDIHTMITFPHSKVVYVDLFRRLFD